MWMNYDEAVEGMDGVLVPIGSMDKKYLDKELDSCIDMDKEMYAGKDFLDELLQDYQERKDATHFFIHVVVAEDGNEDDTWWDFGSILAKEEDGEFYVWSGEDPGEAGSIWYQSTYTKKEAYAVRDYVVAKAKEGKLYNEPNEHDDISSKLYESIIEDVRPDWR